MRLLLFSICIILTVSTFSQNVTSISQLVPEKEYDNIHIKKINTNKNSTSFVIWVKNGVKSHKHVSHHENLYILEGSGEMTIDENTFTIKSGDYFVIPENTYHSLKVTSKRPMKVISVQAPEFIGKDRVFKESVNK
jgi:mannose-6-phosphate isomerase-like protein (cupin superfamily)